MISAIAMVVQASSCAVLASDAPAAVGSAESPGSKLAQFEIPANPEAPATPAEPLLFKEGAWTIKVGVFAGSQLVLEDNAYWGLSEVFAPEAP